ncbi:HEAT repeat domain-containing protein [Nocardia sp. NPDC058480]|uniref:HEAT repeat domain-containing protein n=1 Tax=unclassified Nocardia TaxID=2637762 RepID=UPI003657F38D
MFSGQVCGVAAQCLRSGTDVERYTAKARDYLRRQPDNLALQKLRSGKSLTPVDLKSLEELLARSGAGEPEAMERAVANAHGLFIRSLVGLDQQAVQEAFAEFLGERTATASQIDFVNLVIGHLTRHGEMDPKLLFEAPFTDAAPQGPTQLFDPEQSKRLVGVIRSISDSVVATAWPWPVPQRGMGRVASTPVPGGLDGKGRCQSRHRLGTRWNRAGRDRCWPTRTECSLPSPGGAMSPSGSRGNDRGVGTGRLGYFVFGPRRSGVHLLLSVTDRSVAALVTCGVSSIPWRARYRWAVNPADARLLKDGDLETREDNLRVLIARAEDGDTAAKETLRALVRDYPDYHRSLYSRALNRAAVFGDDSLREPLLAALADTHYNCEAWAAMGCADLGFRDAVPGLVEMLDHPQDIARDQAVVALGILGDESVVPALAPLLQDSISGMRERAAEALGMIGGDAALAALWDEFENRRFYRIGYIASALSQFVPDIIPRLCEAATGDDPDQRYWAAVALGSTGDDRAVPTLELLMATDRGSTVFDGMVSVAAKKGLRTLRRIQAAIAARES